MNVEERQADEQERMERVPAGALPGSRAAIVLNTLSSLRAKLILPYVLLTLLTALVGIYVITRLVSSTVRERFVNQLYEAARVAADGTVRLERTQLSALRLMVFSEGVPQAVQSGDLERLEETLLPLALNWGMEAVVVLDAQGIEILGLVKDPELGEYVGTRGSDFSNHPFVARVLNEQTDSQGDKFTGMIETSAGTFLFTSAPIRDTSDELVGVMLTGTNVQTLVMDLKLQALADIILLNPEGKLIATSMLPMDLDEGAIELSPEEASSVRGALIRESEIYSRDFQIAYGPWVVRQNVEGLLGTVLPSNFLVAAEATSRNTFSILFSAATVMVIVLGYLLAHSIAYPILRLRSMAQAVASGDLEQSSGFRRADEIGDLASAFDIMTARLQARTREAERLYGEAIDRNRQLAEMYEKLQAAQQQLVQSEKLAAVGQLAAGIVHDVKNPLAVIKGMAEELALDAAEDEAAVSGLSIIRDNASRANTIVTDLLTFARQSTPSMEMRDLRDTVQGCLRLTDYLLRKGKVDAKVSLPARAVLVRYDVQQIEQVLVNLIQNAVQAMPDGGELALDLRLEADEAILKVRDTGEGIPPEILARVFDPFFTTKPEGQGTGMGLSVSYGIISRHGGTIEVESEPQEWTEFTIRLPQEPPIETQDEGAAA